MEVTVDLHTSANLPSYIKLAKKGSQAEKKKTKIKYYVVEIV
jgi:hypothetical protein